MKRNQNNSGEVGSVASSSGRKVYLYIRICIALILIYFILRLVDFNEVIITIIKTDVRYMVLIMALALFDRYLMAYKWNLLLKAKGIAFSNYEAFKIYLSSGFIGILLPSTVGGDVVRALRTKMSRGRLDQIAVSIVAERLIGLLVAAILAAFGMTILLGTQEIRYNNIYYAVWFFLITLICFLLLSVQTWVFNFVKRIFSRFEENKLIQTYLDFHSAYMDLSKNWKVLLFFGLLTILRHIVLILMNFYGALALSLPVTFIHVFAIIPIAAIFVLLPISIDSIGVKEGVFIFLFGIAGLSPEESLSLSLFMRVFQWLMLIPAGFVFLCDSAIMKRS